MQGKKILVTGGAGFIGSNLIEKLKKTNKITSLDNYLTGNRANHLDEVTYVEGSCADISNIFSGQRFDNVFHFGEYSRVEQSLNEAQVAFSNGLTSFPAVLDFCLNAGAKMTYSASSTKFANRGSSLSPYTFFKSNNSELIKLYSEWYGLEYTTVYFYNAYGKREISEGKYATLIAKYKRLIESGAESLPVSFPGTQTRNFTHIEDIVDGIIIATDKGTGDGYGIGSDEAFSVLEVCAMFGKKPDMYHTNAANRMHAPVENQRLKALGWSTKHSLREHIDNYIYQLSQ